MLSLSTSTPRRREIWLVNFDPTVGREIQKTRPAVVVNSDAVGRLPIKLVAPITDWKAYFATQYLACADCAKSYQWPHKSLRCVDTLQLRGMDRQRFIRKLGEVSPETIEEIVLAIAAIIEYP